MSSELRVFVPPLDSTKVELLLMYFILRPDVDCSIANIHRALYPDDPVVRTSRQMQQRLASYISEANKRIAGNGGTRRIVPGELKRTYRMTDTQIPA